MKSELVILGVLHRGNFHPYEIKRRLLNAMVECYMEIDVGTLYYAISQLAKSRLITPISREQVVRGGMRTVYAITPAGKKRFQQLLHECFEADGPVPKTLYGALLFLHLGNLPRIAEMLQAKINRQAETLQKVSKIRHDLSPLMASGGVALLDHLEAQYRLDQKWLRALHADVIAGKVRDVADPTRLGIPEDSPPTSSTRSKRTSRPPA